MQEQPPPVEQPAEPPPPRQVTQEVENDPLIEKLKETFLRNCEKYDAVELKDREYTTRVDFKFDPKAVEMHTL